jgi:hypothetical protein
VGHNIRARMGKEGIELEKIRDSEENELRELLEVSLNKGTYLVIDNMNGKDASKNGDDDVDDKEDQKRKYERGEDNEQRFEINYYNFNVTVFVIIDSSKDGTILSNNPFLAHLCTRHCSGLCLVNISAKYYPIRSSISGILIGQMARDVLACLQTPHHGKQSLPSSCHSSCHQDLPPSPPPYKLVEDMMETV